MFGKAIALLALILSPVSGIICDFKSSHDATIAGFASDEVGVRIYDAYMYDPSMHDLRTCDDLYMCDIPPDDYIPCQLPATLNIMGDTLVLTRVSGDLFMVTHINKLPVSEIIEAYERGDFTLLEKHRCYERDKNGKPNFKPYYLIAKSNPILTAQHIVNYIRTHGGRWGI